MFTRSISDECVEHILQSGEAIEDYPHAFPFPAKLLLGRCNGRPIHIVAAENSSQQQVIIITAYEPTLKKWETDMKCVICQYGETEPGTTTVTLTRGETTIVIREVPAQICTICGEEYVDAATGKRLSQIAEQALSEGVQVDVRRYKAA